MNRTPWLTGLLLVLAAMTSGCQADRQQQASSSAFPVDIGGSTSAGVSSGGSCPSCR